MATPRFRLTRAARTAHSVAGAALSLLLVVIGLTGALLVFKDDYLRLTAPEARQTVDLSPEALGAVTEAAEDALGRDALRALVFATPKLGLHKAYLTEGRSAYLDAEGRVLDIWDANGRFEDWLFDLHHRLLSGSVGRYVAGFAGLAATVLVMAGLIAYWPARRAWRRGVLPRSSARVELQAAHRNLGVISAAAILVLAATGGALSFPQTARGLFDAVSARPVSSPRAPVTGADVDWTRAMIVASEAFPDAAPRMALWGGPDRAPSLRLRQPSEWHPNGRTVVIFDGRTAAAAAIVDGQARPAGRRAWNTVYPVHAAHVGGRVYDVIVALTGVAMTLLGVFGLVSFAQRWRSDRRRSVD